MEQEVPFIPSDIIEAILLLLPPQSLGRFKSVSKTWNSLISYPRFIKTYNKKTKKKLIVGISDSLSTRSLYSIELSHDKILTGKKIRMDYSPPLECKLIMGSCNGLLLATIDINKTHFLMNPTTHEIWKLPVNPFGPAWYYGLGYDSLTDDYKVVSICNFPISCGSTLSIYSLRNNSWRKLPNNSNNINNDKARHNDSRIYYDIPCALVNNNCHWFPCTPSIIAFSFIDELFTEIKMPDGDVDDYDLNLGHVVEIGGKLGFYSSVRRWCDSYYFYQLWVMQEYGDATSWTRMFIHTVYPRLICLLEGSDRDIVFRDFHRRGVVVSNLDDGTDEKVYINNGPTHFSSIGFTFVESIESIKRILSIPTKVLDN